MYYQKVNFVMISWLFSHLKILNSFSSLIYFILHSPQHSFYGGGDERGMVILSDIWDGVFSEPRSVLTPSHLTQLLHDLCQFHSIDGIRSISGFKSIHDHIFSIFIKQIHKINQSHLSSLSSYLEKRDPPLVSIWFQKWFLNK